MAPEEIDSALDELENRLDRLRSLYEQYFLGIEKIEPGVARKDVDRRFWILRRTQIRNTARRFRLQTLVQRYNTFQQYWVRICREIENGTYVRHLLKAKKNLGAEPKTWAAKKRMGLLRRDRPAEATGELPPASTPPESRNGSNAGAVENATLPERSNGPTATHATVRAFNAAELTPLDLDFDDAPAPPEHRPAKPATVAAKPAPVSMNTATVAVAAAPSPKVPGLAANAKPPLPTARTAPASGSTTPAAAKPPIPISAARPPLPAQQRPAVRPAEMKDHSGGVSDERLHQLHAELVATRRKLNQADNVSLDSLAKSLRETATKLQAQHQGRAIDFHVVVKDGKPVVKPVVRK